MKEVRDDPCSADDCETSPLYDVRRGLCQRCYNRLLCRGELPSKPTLADLLVRWRRMTESGCWEWRGSIGSNGYGGYCGQYVHRASYELAKGPIPDGLHIDHLCRNRACFNPEHLEPVTPTTNVRRGAASHVVLTGKCRAGHVQDESNRTGPYRTKSGGLRWNCRACAAANYQRRKGLAA